MSVINKKRKRKSKDQYYEKQTLLSCISTALNSSTSIFYIPLDILKIITDYSYHPPNQLHITIIDYCITNDVA